MWRRGAKKGDLVEFEAGGCVVVVAYRKKNLRFYFEFAPICTIFAEI